MCAHRALWPRYLQPLPKLLGLIRTDHWVPQALRDPEHAYHAIPTVGYGLSKMGLNCLTQAPQNLRGAPSAL
jgi:hypothetical protein